MLASINPLVERARGSRYWISVTAYLVGSVVGGVAMGAFAGSIGAVLGSATPIDGATSLWLVAALAGGVFVAELFRLPVPSIHRQVDEAWLDEYRGWVYGFGFGVQLGLGVATIVTTASLYLVFMVAILAGSPGAGIVVGATFGLVRALPILTTARVRDAGRLRAHLATFSAWAPPMRNATAVAVAAMASAAIVVLSLGGAAWPS
jgi:hypothetical protein